MNGDIATISNIRMCSIYPGWSREVLSVVPLFCRCWLRCCQVATDRRSRTGAASSLSWMGNLDSVGVSHRLAWLPTASLLGRSCQNLRQKPSISALTPGCGLSVGSQMSAGCDFILLGVVSALDPPAVSGYIFVTMMHLWWRV